MSFPRYQDYKESSVNWLKQIPKHWGNCRLKNFLSIENGADHKEVLSEDGFPVFGSGGPFAQANRYLYDGETIFLGRKGTIDCPLYYIGKFWAVDTMYWTRVNPNCVGKYVFYSCLTIPFAYYKTSTALPSMTKASLGSHSVCMPPVNEQQAIADFLDRETTTIDSLIAEQERLIELLQEKRQAVISHAVTKGLNPNAPMKDSGVEWLGEVPEHWNISPLNYALKAVGDVDHYMPESVDSGIPYAMTGDLEEIASNINLRECKQVSEKDYEKLSKKIKTQKGDLILARYATIGTVSYVDIDEKLLVSYSCVTIKVNPKKVAALHLFYFIKSQAFAEGIKSKINSNTQDNVGIGDLKKILIALPPTNEQVKIIEYLQSAASQVDEQIQVSRHAVHLLRERRSALISAAVTGQIDVRGLVSEEEAA